MRTENRAVCLPSHMIQDYSMKQELSPELGFLDGACTRDEIDAWESLSNPSFSQLGVNGSSDSELRPCWSCWCSVKETNMGAMPNADDKVSLDKKNWRYPWETWLNVITQHNEGPLCTFTISEWDFKNSVGLLNRIYTSTVNIKLNFPFTVDVFHLHQFFILSINHRPHCSLVLTNGKKETCCTNDNLTKLFHCFLTNYNAIWMGMVQAWIFATLELLVSLWLPNVNSKSLLYLGSVSTNWVLLRRSPHLSRSCTEAFVHKCNTCVNSVSEMCVHVLKAACLIW